MFNLIEKKEKNVFRIKVIADTNDGDYSTGISSISAEDFMNRGIFELMILRDKYGRNHELTNFHYDPIFEMPEGDCYGDYRWHTLESFSIEFISNTGVIYDVELLDYEALTTHEKESYNHFVSKIVEDYEDDEEYDEE